MRSSITRRWIRGNLIIIIGILIITEALAGFFIRNSYYTAATNAILSRVNTISGTLTASSGMSDAEKNRLLYTMSEEFTEKDKFEFMFIGDDGSILTTSTGFMPDDDMHISDVLEAQESDNGIATGTYRTSLGEKVLTATYVLDPKVENIYALRFVTSLEKVDGRIGTFMVYATFIVVLVIAFSVVSGMYFVRSIVTPIREIEAGAAEISKGEFNVRVSNSYNDEIGELRQTINNMAEELGRSDEIKNEFISSVSHELRTPLTAIKGWTETMNANPGDAATVAKGTEVILSETERLNAMVENLLDFSRLQQASIQFTKERLDLVAEISDRAIMFAPRCKRAGIELVFDEPDDIIPVYADKARIKQVMVNLLDNAIKYTDRGGKIEILMNRDRLHRTVSVSVLDNGKGILPEDVEKVTQKFYKGKGSKRGSGIGLALVKEIITAHNGTFTVESEYGKYTMMTFTLHTIKTMRGK